MKANFRFLQKRTCEISYIGNVSGNNVKLRRGIHTFNSVFLSFMQQMCMWKESDLTIKDGLVIFFHVEKSIWGQPLGPIVTFKTPEQWAFLVGMGKGKGREKKY